MLEGAEQLHECCALFADQECLTGYDPPANRRIVPIVVVGGGYPSDPLSRSHVGDVIEQEGWLQDETIETLCILDLVEVEILQSLREARKTPGWLLALWKRPGLGNVGFKNVVVREVGSNLQRPSRMKGRVESALDVAAERLTGRESFDGAGGGPAPAAPTGP